MNFISTTVSHVEFSQFLIELCSIYSKFGEHMKNKEHFIKKENIDVIINSNCTRIVYKNINEQTIQVSVYIEEELKAQYTTTIADELQTASIFTGTELFSKYNKTCISEVNFRMKKFTEILFIRSRADWTITVDIIS